MSNANGMTISRAPSYCPRPAAVVRSGCPLPVPATCFALKCGAIWPGCQIV